MESTVPVSPAHAIPARARRKDGVNVGTPERLLSAVGGGMLAAYGLRRRDLTGFALLAVGGALVARGTTGRCAVYGALGWSSAKKPPELEAGVPAREESALGAKAVRVERSITIAKPREEVYRFLLDVQKLPLLIERLARVEEVRPSVGLGRVRCVIAGPASTEIAWTAELVEDREAERIAWRSVEPSDVESAGAVQLTPAPGGRGTEVKVVLDYKPPAGKLGRAIAKLLGDDPDTLARSGLRRLKQLLEAGEIPTVEGQTSGRKAG